MLQSAPREDGGSNSSIPPVENDFELAFTLTKTKADLKVYADSFITRFSVDNVRNESFRLGGIIFKPNLFSPDIQKLFLGLLPGNHKHGGRESCANIYHVQMSEFQPSDTFCAGQHGVRNVATH